MFKTKGYLLFSVLLAVSFEVQAQLEVTRSLNFDNDDTTKKDKIKHFHSWHLGSKSINIWEVGMPNKNTFNSARSNPNAVVTLLDSTYPINDTSLYTIAFKPISYSLNEGARVEEFTTMSFDYWIDTDSLKDSCLISLHSNHDWFSLHGDQLGYDINWHTEKPLATGRSSGWRTVSFELSDFSGTVSGTDDWMYLSLRFTSDSIETNQDGFMLDNFSMDYLVSVESLNQESVRVYPNPVNQYLSFKNLPSDTKLISIHNSNGQIIEQIIPHEGNQVDLSNLDSGTYLLEVVSDSDTRTTRLIKE